ncbi:MFS transporter [Paralimibaculum aggregatum]|uniref:MFS transporter n=1 Tax=Paralimibaculum aggregatum TaxID=3036245 RepID=A0ABQ6LJ48_9RHOB|nr:MFS transporter [Limibaculum sp. NKW23]GMG82179.1 MFS transporter [Limibaculum sp. NKW23]
MQAPGTARNIELYPWFRAAQNLLFWQAVWFLYFQGRLSPAEAILLAAVYDVATTALEVPSGWMSDRIGRRRTLIASAAASLAGALLLAAGTGFWALAAGQVLIGAGMAFASGTDSALLYESLAAEGRGEEIERHELRAWRASFAALAVSALTGGAMAAGHAVLPFLAGALAFAASLAIALRFAEPPHERLPSATPQGAELLHRAGLRAAFGQPVLRWLMALSVLMYVMSHVPFVFGQPFILDALAGLGLASAAPLVSGAVTAAMMAVSLAASLAAPGLRRRFGLAAILLAAFALQIALSGLMALTDSALAIGLLLLRMVPDALSRPFVLARIQPLLGDAGRASYLSIQSFFGRLLFAATLLLAAEAAPGGAAMSHSEIAALLSAYALAGLACLGGLALAARGLALEPGAGAGRGTV